VEIADYAPDNIVEGGLDRFQVNGTLTINTPEIAPHENLLLASGNPFITVTKLSYKLASDPSKASSLLISDISGKTIEQQDLMNSEGLLSVGERLQSGVYFVSLFSQNRLLKTIKIVKL
jgi:hypothetical protein